MSSCYYVNIKLGRTPRSMLKCILIFWWLSPHCLPKRMAQFLISLTKYKNTCFYRLLDPVGEGEGGMFQENSIETCILSRVKQIASPGWMHETSAQTWCTGKSQRDRVEREVGGGIGMGNTCKSMANSCQCITKTSKNK